MYSGDEKKMSSDRATRADSTSNKFARHDPERVSVSIGDVSELGLYPRPERRHFSVLNIVALSFNICNSWSTIASSLAIAISAGGPATLIYGILLSVTAYSATAASLAELASCYPTAGGQYHFTSILAPKRFSRGLSYACGSIATFSWIAIDAAATLLGAQMLLSIISFYLPSYVPEAWHYFLVYQAIHLVLFLYNLVALVKTPWVHNLGLLLTLCAFVVITITCLARSEKRSSEYVWATLDNNTGWPSGVTFLTGLATPAFMYAGLDASMHLAEECTEPEKTVPRALMATILIGFITGFAFSIAILMHASLGVPVWALIVEEVVVIICGCIYLGSTAAFNALINTAVILQIISFAIPCALLLLRGRSERFLAKGRWFCIPGWLGWVCNGIVVVYAVIELVFFDLPTSIPTTGSSMNYTCAVLATMAVFSGINWLVYARKHYKGPRIDLSS
ncbi:amino acid transporter [Aureobasidium pullulans]|nr:amino acid transporter [Aureobasidium pullulans]